MHLVWRKNRYGSTNNSNSNINNNNNANRLHSNFHPRNNTNRQPHNSVRIRSAWINRDSTQSNSSSQRALIQTRPRMSTYWTNWASLMNWSVTTSLSRTNELYNSRCSNTNNSNTLKAPRSTSGFRRAPMSDTRRVRRGRRLLSRPAELNSNTNNSSNSSSNNLRSLTHYNHHIGKN